MPKPGHCAQVKGEAKGEVKQEVKREIKAERERSASKKKDGRPPPGMPRSILEGGWQQGDC